MKKQRTVSSYKHNKLHESTDNNETVHGGDETNSTANYHDDGDELDDVDAEIGPRIVLSRKLGTASSSSPPKTRTKRRPTVKAVLQADFNQTISEIAKQERYLLVDDNYLGRLTTTMLAG